MYRQLLSDTRKKGFQRVMEQAAVIEKHLSVGEKAGFVDVDQLAYLFQDNKKQTIFAMIFAAVFFWVRLRYLALNDKPKAASFCRVQSLETPGCHV